MTKTETANVEQTAENKPLGGSGTLNVPLPEKPNVPLPKNSSGTGGFSTRGWRTEINTKADGRTRFWLKRRGSGSNREAKYGGMFRTLSAERQAQYETNRKNYAKRNRKAQKRKAQGHE